MAKKADASGKDYGNYIVLNGQQLALKKHPTDFSVMAKPEQLGQVPADQKVALSRNMVRAEAKNSGERDKLMDEVRQGSVAHHIYQVQGTDEEIVIDDRIFVKLRIEGTGELERIMQEYSLQYAGKMGDTYVLRLTTQTGMNPLKVANIIAERPGVLSASPQVMLDLSPHQTPALFAEQWYLNVGIIGNPDVIAGADADIPEAWEITRGSPEIVVAVMDDGFDLDHPALAGVRLHAERWNFVENNNDVSPDSNDYHGTPVSSIAVGAHSAGSAMRGIAPNCTFLPVRIGFGVASQVDILTVFRYVAARADVVNCSFGIGPTSFDPMEADFRRELTRLCESGGRRGKGLVMVFSASNDDSPTFLEGSDNVNGVIFTRNSVFNTMMLAEIPSGQPVFSGYPLTPGVVVVGAISSLKRKAGYSSWGPHLTICAPSNNMHYITSFIPVGDPRRARFVANYRGLGQIAASNRPGHGSAFGPLGNQDDPNTLDLNETLYTRRFGGTSGAAPVVTGTVGLILSANPDLSAQEVRQILMATADTDLDVTLDLANDPNLQGLTGEFRNGQSPFFGAGKLNALHAVRRARALQAAEPAVRSIANAPSTAPLRQAAFAELEEQTLGQVSAEKFLEALQANGVPLRTLTLWPEKKKVELFLEREHIGGIKVGDLIIRLRQEKKKVELELPPGFPPRIPPEFGGDRQSGLVLEELLQRLEERIVSRLGLEELSK